MNKLLNITLGCALWITGHAVAGAQETMTPAQMTEMRHSIVGWLECEECTEGQLEAVVKHGKAAVPTLTAVLHGGPSQTSLELQRRHLITTYRELKKYEKTHPGSKVAMSENEYIKIYTDNFVALHRIRAAEALAAIGGPEAKGAIEKAMAIPVRNDVKEVLQKSIEKLSKP